MSTKIGNRNPPALTMDRLYKVTGVDGSAVCGGSGKWLLPMESGPAEWMPRIKKPECCKQGYHLVVKDAVDEWLHYRAYAGIRIFVAEGQGKFDSDGSGKIAFESARLLHEVSFAQVFGDEYNEFVNLPIIKNGWNGLSHRYPSHVPSPACLRRCDYTKAAKG